jgi:putative acetyltransferase
VIVRRVVPADAAPLLTLLRELIAEPGVNVPLQPDEVKRTDEEQLAKVTDFASSPRAAMFVATADNAIVGQISVQPVSTRRALLHVGTLGLAVVKAWRGRGVGAALMQPMLDWAHAAGYTRVELAVYVRNTPAVRLYQKFGFQIEGTRRNYIREGASYVDDYIMARLDVPAAV